MQRSSTSTCITITNPFGRNRGQRFILLVTQVISLMDHARRKWLLGKVLVQDDTGYAYDTTDNSNLL